MPSHLVATFLAVLAAIDPAAPHTGSAIEVASATEYAVTHGGSMPVGYDAEMIVAIMADMAYHESHLNPRAVGPATCKKGDCGSYSPWQIEHHPEFRTDTYGAARWYYDLLKRSIKMCPAHPLAMMTSGSCKRHALADDRYREAMAALRQAEMAGIPQ